MSARRKRGLVPDDGAGGMNGDDPDDGRVARFQRGDLLFGKKKLKTEVFWSYKFFEMRTDRPNFVIFMANLILLLKYQNLGGQFLIRFDGRRL